MAEKKKWGIYRRRSTKGQEGNESFGIQERACLSYILQRDPTAQNEKRIKYYDDDGVSGAFLERAGVLEMIADAENGELNEIVCQKIDRFTRAEDTGFLLEAKFKQLDVAITSAEGVNVKGEDDISGELMRGVDILFASHGKKRSVIDMRSGRRSKNERGVYGNGGRLVWGYYQRPKKDIHDKEDRPILTDAIIKGHWHLIYDLIVNRGYTLYQVCEELNKNGIKTPRGKDWRTSTLSQMLNEKYSASALYGKFYANRYITRLIVTPEGESKIKYDGEKDPKEWLKIPIPNPIFTERQYRAIRKALARPERKGRKRKGKDYLIPDGILKCGLCGAKIKTVANEYTNYYGCFCRWASKKTLKEIKRKKCSLSYVRAEYLDYYIWDEIVENIIWNEEALEEFLDINGQQKEINNLSKNITNLKKRVRPLLKEKKKLYDMYSKDKISDAQLMELIKEKDEELKSIRERIEEKEERQRGLEESTTNLAQFKEEYERLRRMGGDIVTELSFEEKQSIIAHLFRNMDLRLVPSTHPDAWYTQGNDVGVELKWGGSINAEKFLALLRSMNKDYMQEFTTPDSKKHIYPIKESYHFSRWH